MYSISIQSVIQSTLLSFSLPLVCRHGKKLNIIKVTTKKVIMKNFVDYFFGLHASWWMVSCCLLDQITLSLSLSLFLSSCLSQKPAPGQRFAHRQRTWTEFFTSSPPISEEKWLSVCRLAGISGCKRWSKKAIVWQFRGDKLRGGK